MKVQLLPSTIDENGKASARQHLLTMVIDDRVAIDAGCLAMACSDKQRSDIRDILLTHTHLDHIAGLPMFIDDLFASLTEPIRIHATTGMIETLERDIFNWSIYPRFSELSNENGAVVEYREIISGEAFVVAHLSVQAVPVNHEVAANGYIVSDGTATFAVSGDTAETGEFWNACNSAEELKAVFVECAFPDELGGIASVSRHLTPKRLQSELTKLSSRPVPVYVINIKPMYRDKVIGQLDAMAIPNVNILDIGRVYEF